MPRRIASSFTTSPLRTVLSPLFGILLCTMLAIAAAHPLLAATTTATTLTASPNALAPGKPARLVATVSDASHSIISGTVSFYDGRRLLGAAQVVTHPSANFPLGTATLDIASFDAGSNSLTAVFAGTKSYLSSTSPAQTVTVAGAYPTATALTVTGTSGNYDIIASIDTVGIPTGSVDFLNQATGASLGSLSLSDAKLSQVFVTGSAQQTPDYVFGLAVGDFNGDGHLDAAVDYIEGILVYLGKGDGSFGPPTYYAGLNSFGEFNGVSVGDFNNDGVLDLMVMQEAEGSNGLQEDALLYVGKGDGTFSAPVAQGLDQNGNSCLTASLGSAVTDLDRDGSLDFVINGYQQASSGDITETVCVLRGNGDGTFNAPQTLSLPSEYSSNVNYVEPVAAGDLNGDGFPDLVLNTIRQETVLIGNGDGTFQPPVDYSVGIGHSFVLGDLNGDGKLDLAVANNASSTVTVSLGKGDGTFGPVSTYPIAGSVADLVIADINRDGKPDLAVGNTESSTTGLPVLLGNGNGTFAQAVGYPTDGQNVAYLLMVADFNGDGLPDLLSNVSFYTNAVLLNQDGSSVTLSDVNLPGPGTSSVFAQYSGDANYDPSTSCDESPGVKPQSPSFTKIYSDHITSTSASVGWTSNFPTNGYVSYGPTSAQGQNSPFEHNATTFHFVNLTGLTPGTTYSYTVTGIAYFAGCNHWTTTSQAQSFTTTAQ